MSGSPAYLPPEVASGESAGPLSDVWALGATLYHALVGRPPYEVNGNVIAVLYQIVHEDPPRPDHAGWLAPLLESTMDRDLATRWSMTRVRDFLRRGADDAATRTMSMTSVARPSPGRPPAAAGHLQPATPSRSPLQPPTPPRPPSPAGSAGAGVAAGVAAAAGGRRPARRSRSGRAAVDRPGRGRGAHPRRRSRRGGERAAAGRRERRAPPRRSRLEETGPEAEAGGAGVRGRDGGLRTRTTSRRSPRTPGRRGSG